jgi:copper/silver efflux system protein
VTPTLGPDATGVGWVYQYALVDRAAGTTSPELRSLQDWNLRYALESVPGVAEVASVGGFVKEYQVSRPGGCAAFGVADRRRDRQPVRASNRDVGGQVLELAGHEYVVRGRGYVESRDLERAAAAPPTEGVPVRVGDVADVRSGRHMRRGFAELDGEGEVVGGIVVMRYGENALAVIDAVEERLAEVAASCPRASRSSPPTTARG